MSVTPELHEQLHHCMELLAILSSPLSPPLESSQVSSPDASPRASSTPQFNAPSSSLSSSLLSSLSLHLPNYQMCEISRPNATFSYLVAVSNDSKCYIALNSNIYLDKLLEVQYPVDIFKGISTGTTVGNISGQFTTFPRYFPFATILNLITKHKLTQVIITGVGWSGTLSHILTFILRELGRSIKVKISMKCVSISGPLCASQSFSNYLMENNLQEYHVTVNYRHFLFDRVLYNYQQLSLLIHSDIESWRPIYEILFNILIQYRETYQRNESNEPVTVDLGMLQRAEELLINHPEYANCGDNLLEPIGLYILQVEDRSFERVILCDNHQEISTVLRTLDNVMNTSYCMPPSSQIQDHKPQQRQPMFSKEVTLKPVLTTLNVIKYTQRCTLIFDGNLLDCTLGREARNEIQLDSDLGNNPSENPFETLPFFIQSGAYEVQPNGKILFVRAMGNKVIIDVSGLSITSPIQIGLRTDFGDSNTITFDPSNIILKDDSAPISLHPVMNSTFLLGALLRVALCYRDCNNIDNLKMKYPFIFQLWVLLLDLERTCPLPNPLLDIQMQAYVNGQFDLIILKNVCNKRMEDISLYITTLENDTEGIIRHGARTMLGGLGRLTGGLITTAGVILTVPSILLSLPAAMYVANQNRNRTEQQPLSIGVGTGLYLSLVGLLSLPGVVVAGLGAVLSSAGSYAMKDKESINYKNILYILLTLLNANNHNSSNPNGDLDVVDEITPLENHVIELFSRYFPQCNLLSQTPEEIYQLILKETGSSNGNKVQNIQAINLIKYYKKNKNIFLKLKLIYKIHHIRKLLENNLFISFLSVDNAKKSKILHHLFDLKLHEMRSYLNSMNEVFLSSSGGVSFGSDPSIHQIGEWMNEQQLKNEIFKDWMNKNERNMLQIYAIDYPFIQQRRVSSDSSPTSSVIESSASPATAAAAMPVESSSYSVELSSIFIILLTEEPNNITAESMKYIDLAKSNHKPYLVLVDLTSEVTMKPVITTPGQYESYKESYSRQLDIPVDLIHFTNPYDPNSTDKLRGLLFGMVQNLIASPYLSQVLSLKFLPSSVVDQLITSFHTSTPIPTPTPTEETEPPSSHENNSSDTTVDSPHLMDILSVPDILATATGSLLYNLCPLTSTTIRDSCKQLLTENSSQILKKSDRRSTLQSLPFAIHLQSQQIAYSLSIPDNICLLFTQILSSRLKLFKDYLKNNKSHNIALNIINLLSDSRSSEVDNMLSVLVLTFIRQQMNEYLAISSPISGTENKSTNIQYLCTEILLGLQIWVNIWTEKGYPQDIVIQAIEVALSDNNPVTNSHFLQIINRLHTSIGLLESFENDPSSSGTIIPPPLLRRVSSSTSQLVGFQFARDQYTQIMKILTFQPFHDIILNETNVLHDHSVASQRYTELMKEYNKSHSTLIKINLTKNTGIVLELIEQLMSFPAEEFKKSKVLFTILSESAVDVNGVTRSILTQIAKEINENPTQILMKKDEQTNLLYFDPDIISQADPMVRRHIQFMCTGFGRLIGLCLLKSSIGATFPIDFSLTFYRLILGYRLGMNDLYIVNPQIATSLSNICLMDQETLDASYLDFTITRNDHSVYELIPNGSNHIVTIHNRVEYIQKALQYYLGIPDMNSNIDPLDGSGGGAAGSSYNPLLSFMIGIQSVCSRHYFHHFNPISLQLLLEGDRLDIDVADWRNNTEYRLQGGTLFNVGNNILTNPTGTTANINELTENIEAMSSTGVISTPLPSSSEAATAPADMNPSPHHDETNPIIQMFWEVVMEMDEMDKRRLLCFSVGTTSLPSNGFSALQPKFTLVIGTLSPEALPVSHTCFHMLILPKYETKTIMKEKLLQAIRETGISDLGIV